MKYINTRKHLQSIIGRHFDDCDFIDEFSDELIGVMLVVIKEHIDYDLKVLEEGEAEELDQPNVTQTIKDLIDLYIDIKEK